jgi:hypothetical protein
MERYVFKNGKVFLYLLFSMSSMSLIFSVLNISDVKCQSVRHSLKSSIGIPLGGVVKIMGNFICQLENQLKIGAYTYTFVNLLLGLSIKFTGKQAFRFRETYSALPSLKAGFCSSLVLHRFRNSSREPEEGLRPTWQYDDIVIVLDIYFWKNIELFIKNRILKHKIIKNIFHPKNSVNLI